MTCHMGAYCSPLFVSKLYRQPQAQRSDLSAKMPPVDAYTPGCGMLSDLHQALLLPMATSQTRPTLEPTYSGYDAKHAPPGSDMGPCGQFIMLNWSRISPSCCVKDHGRDKRTPSLGQDAVYPRYNVAQYSPSPRQRMVLTTPSSVSSNPFHNSPSSKPSFNSRVPCCRRSTRRCTSHHYTYPCLLLLETSF